MKDPRVKKLLAAQNDWLLLLQIDTDVNGPGWTWGDNGRLYFYIRKQDLLLHNFEAAWLFLQCWLIRREKDDASKTQNEPEDTRQTVS